MRHGPAINAELAGYIARTGHVTLRSFGGTWIGMDGDTDLTFHAGGRIDMTEYGDAVIQFTGVYQVADDGRVTATFPKFGQPWPTMILGRDDRSLLLLPADENGGVFVVGNPGGATMTGGSYWPFRPTTRPTSGR